MALPGTIQAAPGGAHGFDCNTKLTATSAAGLRSAGFTFAIRYVKRSTTPPAGDLTAAEARLILNGGLALMPVQHVAPAGWVPTEAKGKTNGANAVSHVNMVGFPVGVNVWLDLEGVAHNATAEATVAYCNAWFEEVSTAGFVPGIYIGAGATLDGEQLYWGLKTRHYWKSGRSVPDVPERSYGMVQLIVSGDVVAGVEIDRNVTKTDNFGNSPLWLKM